jgi:hypothetical protein
MLWRSKHFVEDPNISLGAAGRYHERCDVSRGIAGDEI